MRSLLPLLSLSLLPYLSLAQNGRVIASMAQPLGYAPTRFHIAAVVDDRGNDKATIGTIKTSHKENLVLDKGSEAWLARFISATRQNKGTAAITLHIVRLASEMKQKASNAWEVNTEIDIAFYVGDRKLVSYSGSSKGETGKTPDEYFAEFVNHALTTDFQRFDEWWSKNGNNVPANDEVKVNVTILKTTDKPNTIVYDRAHPLKISDFQGEPNGAWRELAATYSGSFVSYQEKVEKGQTILEVQIAPLFDKSRSWFKPEGKNPEVLAHEQAHFDITAIKACELARALCEAHLTRKNFAAIVQKMEHDSTEATNEEEERYDSETEHGILTDKQTAWEKKVKEQIKTVGCY